MYIYEQTDYDLSCAGTLQRQYDQDMADHLWDERSLAHDRGPRLLCTDFQPGDIVNCVYIFGETVLVSQHEYGKCPYLLPKHYQKEAAQ